MIQEATPTTATTANGLRGKILAANNKGKVDLTKIYPDMVIMCTFDPETGERVFTEGDRDEIGAKNGKAVERIADVAGRISGLNEAAEKAVKND